MGTSNWQNISYSIEMIREINPRSVLDVGSGFGRWGFLCREMLDVWEGRTYPESWQVRIDAIEAFPPNITPVYDYVYDNVYKGDAAKIIDELGEYDLIIFGDVLEHFSKREGDILLKKAVRRAQKAVLIHIPLGKQWPQSERDNNTYEEHRSVWEASNLLTRRARLKVFRDYIGRRFAVAIILKPGVKLRSRVRRWLGQWRRARKADLKDIRYAFRGAK
ncbi:MAG TPA: class I SAM-dependent methyltransferase [Chloroflexia bacterium]